MPAPAKTPAKISVDFTGVEAGGGRKADYLPEGDYLARVQDCQLKSKQDDPTRKYLSWYLEIMEPSKYKSKHVYLTTSLVAEALWKLRGFLIDMLGEKNVPQKALDIPLAKIVAAHPLVGITLEDDEYKGKQKSNVAGTFSKADWQEMKTTNAPAVAEAEAEEAEESETSTDSAETDEEMDELDLEDL